MARAIWKGVVRFEDVEVPVKFYSAVQDRGVHFRLLHEKDLEPVKQHMVDPSSGEVVPYEQIRRGAEIERGVYVILDDEEVASLEPTASRDIEITRFVDPSLINHQWYDRPYYLGPDGDAKAYAALVDALEKEGKEGVARWVMRKKEYLGALRGEDAFLMMITLRSADEVVPADAIEPPAGRKPDEKELRMARQLIDTLAGDFDPTEWRDEYRDRVLELVQTKAEGGTIELKPVERKKPSRSLADTLEASLKSAKREKAVA